MKFKMIPIFLLIVMISVATVWAETRYISDVLLVTLRSNTTNNHQVLERLTSNTPVTFLAEEGDFFRVRTASGAEGYILKQFVTRNTPKTMIIEQLQAQIDTLKRDYAGLQERQARLQESGSEQVSSADLTLQLEETRSHLKQITEQYDSLRSSAADVLKLHEDNQRLIEQNQVLNRELYVLREENSSFHRANTVQWFFAGAGVFFGGWLIGKVSRQKPRGFGR